MPFPSALSLSFSSHLHTPAFPAWPGLAESAFSVTLRGSCESYVRGWRGGRRCIIKSFNYQPTLAVELSRKGPPWDTGNTYINSPSPPLPFPDRPPLTSSYIVVKDAQFLSRRNRQQPLRNNYVKF